VTAEEFIERYAETQDIFEDRAFKELYAILHKDKTHWAQVVLGGQPDDVSEVRKLLTLVPDVIEKCGRWLPLSVLRLTVASRDLYPEEWRALLKAARAEYDRRELDTNALLSGLKEDW
jgi:hypothetical protein